MFILLADWSKEPSSDDADEIASMIAAHKNYFAYVEDNRARFPQKAYELAASAWRHDFSDHRAFHDSWVESFRFLDSSLPNSGGGRANDLELVLLGAYHDGRIRIRYSNVHSAQLFLSDARDGPIEIYRDEIRLSETGLVLHEIEFLARDNWIIECDDIEQQWEPFSDVPAEG